MKQTLLRLASGLAAVLLLGSCIVAAGAQSATPFRENGLTNYQSTQTVYTIDAQQALDTANGAWGFVSESNIKVENGVIKCKPLSGFGITSGKLPGDDYALTPATVSFDMQLSAGTAELALRLLKQNDTVTLSGFYITFAPDGTLTLSEANGYHATLATGLDLTQPRSYRVEDRYDALDLYIDGALVLRMHYGYFDKTLAVTDKQGNAVGQAATYDTLPYNGYFRLSVNRLSGYLDNISYNHNQITQAMYEQLPLDYSTWVATDDLDRVTPDADEVGRAQDKYVGIFYFMIHSDDMGSRHVDDTTATYLQDGLEALKQMLASKAGKSGVYWAEPYFGYYSSHDVWVYAKHAMMLDAAGVDFIFVDFSNDKFYPEQFSILCETWLQMREYGMHTPQIVLMFGEMPFTLLDGLWQMYDSFYQNPKYKELLFTWEGKPLVLGNSDTPNKKTWTVSTSTTPQSKAEYTAKVNANPQLKAFYEDRYADALATLTVRKCWAWQAGLYNGYWDWLQDTPQANGTAPNGNPEQMAVTMGFHAHTSRGRSFVGGKADYDQGEDFGFTLGTARYGRLFAEQFEYALSKDVQVIMITGWNEWYAGVMQAPSAQQTTGATLTPNYYLVDQFTPEYSRDGEPMRIRDGQGSVGFGDNYYYQMVSYIRRFKGLDAASTVNKGTIDLNAADLDAQWQAVTPTFTDTVNDARYRSEYSFGSAYRYINNTGRNDIAFAKVSQDDTYLYFYVTTANPLILTDDADWMNLYLNVNGDGTDGWEGYDFAINRARDGSTMQVEAFAQGSFEGSKVGTAEYATDENSIVVKVEKALLGYKAGEIASLDFKWADHSSRGDVMQFMDLGDAAPNDRFAFAYKGNSLSDDTASEQDTTVAPEDTDGSDASVPGDVSYTGGLTVLILAVALSVASASVFALALIRFVKSKKA